MNPPLESIEISVTEFQDIRVTNAQPRWCRVENPRARSGAGRVTLEGSTVVVHGTAPVDLEFVVTSPVEGRNFWPIGICFWQTWGFEDRHGRANFAIKSFLDHAVIVSDAVRHHAPRGNAPTWKFYLAIQADDGAIGLIDPEVQNED